jgi:citrate lyase alpha subunit
VVGQKRETFEPVTLGHIRSHGCRDLLVYCGSINSAVMSGPTCDQTGDRTAGLRE